MSDNKDFQIVIKGGYYEYPTLRAKRKINFTKWGTPMRSSRSSNEKSAPKENR